MNKQICIISSGTIDNSYGNYLIGIKKRASALGYTAVFFSPLIFEIQDPSAQLEIFNQIDYSKFEGLIFLKASFSSHKGYAERIEEKLRENCTIPVVTIGFSDTGEKNAYPTIELDTREDFCKVTEHAITVHGCKTIYCLGGYKNTPDSCIEGFKDAFKKHNLPCPPEFILYGGYWKECAIELAKNIAYETVAMPEAVVCLTDVTALQLITSLAGYGIKIPDDLIVLSYSGFPCAFNEAMSITTLPINFEEYGEKAVTLLHKQITGEDVPSVPHAPKSIITGLSCGCGTKVPMDLRQKLDHIVETETYTMYFNNSRIEELFYSCQNYKELLHHINHNTYLIPNKALFSFSLYENDGKAYCYFISDSYENSPKLPLKKGQFLPDNITRYDDSTNYHIVPIFFKDTIYGFAVLGYNGPYIYNDYFIKFIKILSNAIYLLKTRLELTEQINNSEKMSTVNTPAIPTNDFIFIKKEDSLFKLPYENIYYFETEGRKTLAYTKTDGYETGKTLAELEEMLRGIGFLRIGKSVIVNTKKISAIHADSNRTYEIVLHNKKHLHVSRNYFKEFKDMIM